MSRKTIRREKSDGRVSRPVRAHARATEPAATTWQAPATFQQVRESECTKAQLRDSEATAPGKPELLRLALHVGAAFDATMTIVKSGAWESRPTTWGTFARAVVSLQEACRYTHEAFKTTSRESIDRLHRTPGLTFPLSLFAQDTYLLLAWTCSQSIFAEVVVAGGTFNFAKFDDLPADAPSFGEWIDRLMKLLRQRGILPAPEQWPLNEMWRSGSSLMGKLRAEYEAATGENPANHSAEDSQFAADKVDDAILKVLERNREAQLVDEIAQRTGFDRKIVGPRLKFMLDYKLVRRPTGRKRGYLINSGPQ